MKVLVTGGTGFVGKHLVPLLSEEHEVIAPVRHHWVGYPWPLDLLLARGEPLPLGENACSGYWHSTGPYAIADYLIGHKIDAIVHLAGVVGGIGFNQNNQGKLGYENLLMGMNLLEGAHIAGVKKVVMLGTTCSYPHTPKTIPFIEDELFDGMPEMTNSGYGVAKRTLVKLGIEYSRQYGMQIVNLIPTNMLGEHDHFEEERSHVIPALIKKFENPAPFLNSFNEPTGNTAVMLWGTGSASRDFLYVGDCARAIAIALKKDVGPEPINLGTGREVSIKELAETIKTVGNYKAEIFWDKTKPDGQPRRSLDATRAKNILKWEATTSLEEALERTIRWYRNQ